jgi:hypothetical protein
VLMPASGVVGLPRPISMEDEVVAGHERLSLCRLPRAQ